MCLFAETESEEERRNPGALIGARGNLRFVPHAPSFQFGHVLQIALADRLRRVEFTVTNHRYGSALLINWSFGATGGALLGDAPDDFDCPS